MTRRITALIGAQYGSEGKGLIAAHLARSYDIHVRVGAPNAGHTYYTPDGRKMVARSIPCAAGVDRNASLVVGAGALIDVHLLVEEAKDLNAAGFSVHDRLIVDQHAVVIDPMNHHAYEGGVLGRAHERIGSTGEGVGLARMAKINRNAILDGAWTHLQRAEDFEDLLNEQGIAVEDTALWLNQQIDVGQSVLLEGTQGSGLSITHGPWPYVTSTDTNAAQMAADVGVAPQLVTDTILVARTYPIRVAGNSGPLRQETSFEALGLEEERTTVTKKVRRIGQWSDDLVLRAVMLNRPTEIALTFVDYWDDAAAGVDDENRLPGPVQNLVDDIEAGLGVHISMLGTGPFTVCERARRWEPKTVTFPNAWESYWLEAMGEVTP